ncbi:MAG: serine--tRNA ligase [Acidimicrobiales bacterium]
MIDTRLLLDDFERTAHRLGRKGVSRQIIDEARARAEARRSQVRRVDEARQGMNAGSQEVGRLMRAGEPDEATRQREKLAGLKDDLERMEQELRQVEADLDDAMLRLPNLPADDVPDGRSEADNVVVRTDGYDPADYEGRSYRPHWEVASDLGILDAERAAKLSGAMFSLLSGGGARLLRGLVNFAVDLHGSTYLEVAPPHAVRSEVISRTGHLTQFVSQAYRLRDDDLWLVPTAEVPLMGLYQGEILAEADLPARLMAYTVCWRREAGAAGKDTRGLQRLHEFHKVELVKLCRPEDSAAELASLLADCERTLQTLGLPYRVVELCAGDLTFSASKVYDLEVYAPGVDRWLEVSSVSLVTDFQARRGSIRFRRTEGSKVELVHSLNGSGLATPRVWAAIIEHGQQPDGTVRVPDVLIPYVGADTLTAATLTAAR